MAALFLCGRTCPAGLPLRSDRANGPLPRLPVRGLPWTDSDGVLRADPNRCRAVVERLGGGAVLPGLALGGSPLNPLCGVGVHPVAVDLLRRPVCHRVREPSGALTRARMVLADRS